MPVKILFTDRQGTYSNLKVCWIPGRVLISAFEAQTVLLSVSGSKKFSQAHWSE